MLTPGDAPPVDLAVPRITSERYACDTVLKVTTAVPLGELLVKNTIPCGVSTDPENARPVPKVTAVGAALVVAEFPSNDDAVIDDIDIVPTPVIGPPVSPAPVFI